MAVRMELEVLFLNSVVCGHGRLVQGLSLLFSLGLWVLATFAFLVVFFFFFFWVGGPPMWPKSLGAQEF